MSRWHWIGDLIFTLSPLLVACLAWALGRLVFGRVR
jgi:hypothetical protein